MWAFLFKSSHQPIPGFIKDWVKDALIDQQEFKDINKNANANWFMKVPDALTIWHDECLYLTGSAGIFTYTAQKVPALEIGRHISGYRI